MTNSDRRWAILAIDDSDEVLEGLHDWFAGFDCGAGPCELILERNFSSGLERLRAQHVDIVILDLYQGDVDLGDDAGLLLLEEWQGVAFAPVIVHSALPEAARAAESPFVRLVTKDTQGPEMLEKQVRWLFQRRIPQMCRALSEHVTSTLRDHMWGFVAENFELFEPLLDGPEFLRALLNRVSLRFSSIGVQEVIRDVYTDVHIENSERVHPSAFYVRPPVADHPLLGDLVCRDGTNDVYVILWPSCDLLPRAATGPKVERALCAVARPLIEFEEYQSWSAKKNTTREKALRRLLTNQRSKGQAERYHFLPPALDLHARVVDFADLHHVSVEDISTGNRLATISSPYAEQLSQRFGRYLGRIGTPDLDLDSVMKSIEPQARPDAQVED